MGGLAWDSRPGDAHSNAPFARTVQLLPKISRLTLSNILVFRRTPKIPMEAGAATEIRLPIGSSKPGGGPLAITATMMITTVGPAIATETATTSIGERGRESFWPDCRRPWNSKAVQPLAARAVVSA